MKLDHSAVLTAYTLLLHPKYPVIVPFSSDENLEDARPEIERGLIFTGSLNSMAVFWEY